MSALGAVLLTLALILAACDSGGSSSNSDKSNDTSSSSRATSTTGAASGGSAQNAATTPVGAEAAVAEWVKGQGLEYAGDCADAQLPQDKGKWCSTLKSSDPVNGTETYDVGPVGEQPQKTITVKPRAAAQLTPGYQVGVGDSNVGTPRQLTQAELQADAFITGNLLLDQAAGIGNGLSDLPAGAPTGNEGGGGGGGGGTGTPATTIPGGGGGGAGGGAEYPPTGGIVVTNPTVDVGGEVGFRGSGCVANEPLTISFDGHPIGTINADASGSFAGSISIPKGTAPGTHVLTVQGSGCVFNTTITVAGSLAFTGSSSNTSTYVLAGIAAVVVGAVLVIGSRRRRRGVRGRSFSP
jgi:LPXTG-motif cell wall-anchored protein